MPSDELSEELEEEIDMDDLQQQIHTLQTELRYATTHIFSFSPR